MAKYLSKNPRVVDIYECAKVFWEKCLVGDGSLVFDGSVWTLGHLEIIHDRFVLHPDEGKADFAAKLRGQIAEAGKPITRLGAELLAIYYLFPTNVSGKTKRDNVNTVLNWSGDALPEDSLLSHALDYGIGGVGTGYLAYQPLEVTLLINTSIAFKNLSLKERQSLNDPWKFQTFLDAVPGAEKRQGRHTLLHILFPDYFERIATGKDKCLIVEAFKDKSTEENPDVDHQLFSIRKRLEMENPREHIDFYNDTLKITWKYKVNEDKKSLENEFIVWFSKQISQKTGTPYVEATINEYTKTLKGISNYLKLQESEPINFFHYTTRNEFSMIHDKIRNAPNFDEINYSGGKHGEYSAALNMYDKFLAERENTLPPVESPQIPPDTPREQKPSLVELYTLQTILNEGCFLPYEELEKMLVRLQEKKNIILQGPPGTGKTWLGKRLAYALIGSKYTDRVRSVQFHSTISYEDFVRGWRPAGEGKLKLCDGPFLELIHEAETQPDKPFVMLIEEINRGNPAQIFGELLTLLEADKRHAGEALQLCYQEDGKSEAIHIPSNIHVIGTMNIADRSLALVDFALRRRFAFITLAPTFGETWQNWMTRADKAALPSSFVEEVAQKMLLLNESIAADPALGWQYAVGHSYVTIDTPIENHKKWFLSVIVTELEPLLREYWFDAPERVAEEISKLKIGITA